MIHKWISFNENKSNIIESSEDYFQELIDDFDLSFCCTKLDKESEYYEILSEKLNIHIKQAHELYDVYFIDLINTSGELITNSTNTIENMKLQIDIRQKVIKCVEHFSESFDLKILDLGIRRNVIECSFYNNKDK